MANGISDKNGILCLVFLIIFGPLGIHRFYAGKVGTGVLFLITVGGFGIWWLIDLIMIVMGNFTDGDGNPIKLGG